jgi:flagellar hook-associated protein 3 FlgL
MNTNIVERIDNIEYVDSAEAIMDYKMQQYVYRAALQMGVQILQPTLLDFID